MKKFLYIKEELLALPIIIIAVYIFREWLVIQFPEVAVFDFWSEIETLATKFSEFLFITLGTWFFMWITFPWVHRFLARDFRAVFSGMPVESRLKYSFWIWTVLLISFVLLVSGGVKAADCNSAIREQLLKNLESQLHIRELTGKNDGYEIDKRLKSVNAPLRSAWCGGHVGYNYQLVGVPNPQSGWSPDYARKKDIVFTPKGGGKFQPGDAFTLFYANLNRVGHVGFVVAKSHSYIVTNEGNTNNNGSRQGIGVFKLKRDIRKLHAVTDYITPYANNIKDTGCAAHFERLQQKAASKQNGTKLDAKNYHTARYHNSQAGRNDRREADTIKQQLTWMAIGPDGVDWRTHTNAARSERWEVDCQLPCRFVGASDQRVNYRKHFTATIQTGRKARENTRMYMATLDDMECCIEFSHPFSDCYFFTQKI